MSTAMSTKRSFVPAKHEAKSGVSLGILALAGGILLIAAGIALNASWAAVAGFVPFTTAAIYYNNLFWAKMYDSKKLQMPSRKSIARYY
jgi:fatty acid desaturase